MTGGGLGEVPNPSELFLGERNAVTPGAAVFAGMEGTRPLLVEIQALVAPTALGTPRRAVIGWDQSRLAMVLAVLEAHCRVRLADCDVYLNVAGGLRISEPAADLAVAAALVSSRLNAALPADCVYFGEISLSGSIRPVSHAPARLKEAQKLGFGRAVLPSAAASGEGVGPLFAASPSSSTLSPPSRPRREADRRPGTRTDPHSSGKVLTTRSCAAMSAGLARASVAARRPESC